MEVEGIHGALRIHPNDFRDPLSFPLPPSAGQTFWFFSEMSQQLLDGLPGHLWFPGDVFPLNLVQISEFPTG